MQEEYDFSGGVRGKHYEAYRQGTNLVLLEPEIARMFKEFGYCKFSVEEVGRNCSRVCGEALIITIQTS